MSVVNFLRTVGDITGHVNMASSIVGNNISIGGGVYQSTIHADGKISVNNRPISHSGAVKIFVEYFNPDTKETARELIPAADFTGVNVEVQGNAGNVTVSNGQVIVHGNANQVNNTNGKVKVGQDVLGNCQTSNGEIYARNVNGNVTTSNADIYIEGEARGLKRTSNGRVVRQ